MLGSRRHLAMLVTLLGILGPELKSYACTYIGNPYFPTMAQVLTSPWSGRLRVAVVGEVSCGSYPWREARDDFGLIRDLLAEVAVVRHIPADAQGARRLRFHVDPNTLCYSASATLCNGRATSQPEFSGKYLVIYKEWGIHLQFPPDPQDREFKERLKVVKSLMQERLRDAATDAHANGVFSIVWSAPCLGGYCSRAVYDLIAELLTLPKGFWLIQPKARGGFGPAHDPQAPTARTLVSMFVGRLASKDRGLRITVLRELAHIPGLARFLSQEERAQLERVARQSRQMRSPESPDELAEYRARQELEESMRREGLLEEAKR